MTLKVFISYANEDRDRALHYYELLSQEGALPWLDVKKLLPGQNWEAEIERAFSEANVVVLLLSKRSVNKRGFVQREANDAIERLRYKQPTDIYVIPLLLEQCDVPAHIAGRLQYVDLSTPGAWAQVRSSLKLAAEQQSIDLASGISAGPFRVFTEKVGDIWKGTPGHDIDIEFPRFEWVARPDIAEELTQYFAGRATKVLMEARQKPWKQSPEMFADTDVFSASDGRWDSFGIAFASERLLSLTYEVGWYGAGAAHPNTHFETYNFAILDRLYILDLEDFFSNGESALKRISELCIDQLCRELWSRVGEKPEDTDLKWFKTGAGENFENFQAFTVGPDHFTFLFAPYQVNAFALGRWSVDVSFYDLLADMNIDGPYRLTRSELQKT